MSKCDEPTATEWFCPECGDEISMQEPCESWPCVECGTEMEPAKDMSEYVRRSDLEALADELNESAEHMASQNVYEWADGLQDAERKLRELLEGYE